MIKKPLFNNQIRAPRVRVIDEAGKQLGIISIQEALQTAKERNLDLIQVTERVEPPVCKLMDYGKYLYSEQKRARKEAKQQKSGQLKQIRISFVISAHDLETKAIQAGKFLKKGDKVKIEMRLRGREKSFGQLAREKMNKFLEILRNSVAIKIEREIKREPRGLTMIISKE
ncbi:MAG: translation initiation factor IF-3 [Candidatus Nealsonbacteria bacterium RBG_13_36_15]|uniref:Translation initiation factor IF-3 n=1 Tax=Candidatus Nealsonbacteria bacterium RBG_13_36_15 TaxID=1801660 RepID=A0A1G2DVJ0_9BACT|nr:MAG: translation initiation factor IF-3 [Candidatus Nealsonbacteria bacterium RBG_13_36_15]